MISITKDVKEIIKFLRNMVLFRKELKCERCNCQMTLMKHVKAKDSEMFPCNKCKSAKFNQNRKLL